MPQVAPGDVVLLLNTSPMAYLALFQDPEGALRRHQ